MAVGHGTPMVFIFRVHPSKKLKTLFMWLRPQRCRQMQHAD
jgi:hypothetical protein